MAGKDVSLEMVMTFKDQVSQQLSGIQDQLQKLTTVTAATSALATGGLTELLHGFERLADIIPETINAAAEEQVSLQRLGAAVQATGANWQDAQEAVEAYIRSEERRTAITEESGIEGLARLTEATGSYVSAMKLLPIAEDLAAAKGMDLSSAAELVGKVAEGNVSVLSRYGIVLQKGTDATQALMEMQQRFGGQGEAFANTLRGQQAVLDGVFDHIKEGIGNMFVPALTRITRLGTDLLDPLQAGLSAIGPLVGDELGKIVDMVAPYGENVSGQFAEGIARGLPYVVAAFRVLREMVQYLLQPGSPPRLLPELTDWGQGAANAYFQGWTAADFDILKGMSASIKAVLEGLVGEGSLSEGEVNPILRSVRAQIGAALDELERTGSVSQGTMSDILAAAGPAGAGMQGYVQAYLRVAEIQHEMATNTDPTRQAALQLQLQGAQVQLQLEEARIGAVNDETALMREQDLHLDHQVQAMREIATHAAAIRNDVAKAADGVKAFDPAQFRLPAIDTKQADLFDKYFNVDAINKKADEIANGVMPKLTPFLDWFKTLVGGEVVTMPGGSGGAPKSTRTGGMFQELYNWLFNYNWAQKLASLGITPDTIKTWTDFAKSIVSAVDALNRLAEAIRKAIDAWNKRPTGFAGGSLPGMNMPGTWTAQGGGARAGGGPVYAGSAYVVGEQGPELFVPDRTGTIVPNRQIGGTVVVQFVYAPTFSLASRQEAYEAIAPVIAEVMRREARRG